MIEAIQNTAGLFFLLAMTCIFFDKEREVLGECYICGLTVAITLILSVAVIFVTALIRIWT